MRVSHQHSFIFFAVPRTGSTTVRRVLDQYSDIQSVYITETDEEHPFYHHISPREVLEIFDERGWTYEEYRTFCFVRNPWDRVVSLFHHRMKMWHDGWVGTLKRKVKMRVKQQQLFDQFVKNQISDWGRLEEPVTHFISDDVGAPLVDDVLKFENISTVLPGYLSSHFGISLSPNQLPHKNRSHRKSYGRYYDAHTKSIIDSVYEADIKRFSYSF